MKLYVIGFIWMGAAVNQMRQGEVGWSYALVCVGFVAMIGQVILDIIDENDRKKR